MSNNVLFKDAIRTIGRTRSRFFSIVLIVALGISFFAGFSATAPFMRETIKEYYENTNAADIRIVSSIGLTDEDVKVIKTIDGVEAVSGDYFVDGLVDVDETPLCDIDGSRLTIRAYALDINKAVDWYSNGTDDPSFINRPQLIEGNWPKSANECLVDESTLSTPTEFVIGANLELSGEGSDITGNLKTTEYKVVGIIRTPLYVSYERGNTTIGTGKLGTFIYIPSENFDIDYYSSISVTLKNSSQYNPYSEEYTNFVAPYVDFINSFANERAMARAKSIKGKYAKKLAEAETEYAETKAKVEQQIADGEEQVKTILDMAENGDEKLAGYKAEYNAKAMEAQQTIESSKLEHSDGYAQYEEKLKQYNEAKDMVAKYSNAEVEYRTSLSEYNVANTAVNTLSSTVDYLEKLVATTRSAVDQLGTDQQTSASDIINRFETSGLVGVEVDQIVSDINSFTAVGTAQDIAAYMEPELQSLEEQLSTSKRQLADAKTDLAEKKAALDEAKALVEKLKEVEASLQTAETDLNLAKEALSTAGYDIQLGELEALTKLSDMKNQITNYETALSMAKAKADTIEEEFEAQKKEANDKLQKAQSALNNAKNFLLDLDSPKWYVQDRNEGLVGFEGYGQACDRTEALAIVFPWFFFIVAALVSLNTMTRMIEDERTQLGTLKALGFQNSEILKKYLAYAFFASGIGAVAGSLMGFAVFPLAISSAYGILFEVPTITVGYDYMYAGIGVGISVGVTVLSTYIAAKRALKIHPSILMKPKAPKGGKRIPLERVTFIWNKLSFNSKVTFRNVFRNKKRFFMAVMGVMGCTSLMVAGFGLRNSTNDTMRLQFSNDDSIWCYDMQIVLNGSVDTTMFESKAANIVKERAEIGNSMLEYMKVFNTSSSKSDELKETYIMVPENADMVSNYINIRQTDKTPLSLNVDGAVITIKLAEALNIGVGDNIEVNLEDGYKVNVPVCAIADNYCFHYLYLSKDSYHKYFGTNPRYNYIAANFASELSDEQKSNLSQELMNEYDISAVSYSGDIQGMFENTLQSIDYIVIILIVSAALLSLIVMYNLSVMNINERAKEIATIKVLGFNRMETRNYIFRENILLSALGTFVGLFLGVLCHRIVIKVAEVDIIRYGREIGWFGFVAAAALSMLFCLVVNLILTKAIKDVDMVESLKFNE